LQGNAATTKLIWQSDFAKDINGESLFSIDLEESVELAFADNLAAYAYDTELNEYDLVLRDVTELPRTLMYQKAGELIVEHMDADFLQVLDLQGRVLNTTAVVDGFAKIPTSNYVSGIYLVRLEDRTEKVFIK